MDNHTVFRTAAALGISAQFIMSGYSFCASHLVIPPLLNIPTKYALPPFRHAFETGGTVAFPLNGLAFLAFATAAYFAPPPDPLNNGVDYRTRYAVAAVTALSPLVFTATVMLPGIKTLLKAEESEAVRVKMGDADILKGLKAWRSQNLVRAALSLVAASVGALTFAA